MADVKDVELRIRAILDGKKSLTETVDALKELAKAQDLQLEAAKRGEASARSLSRSYEDLQKAAQSVAAKAALVTEYQNQAQALAEVKARLDAAREAQAAFVRSLGDGKPTKDQAEQLKSLGTAVRSAEQAQIRFQNRVDNSTRKLADAGIAVTDLASAQAKIIEAGELASAALLKQDQALRTLDADLAAHKARIAEVAKAEADLAAAQRSIDDARNREAADAAQFEATRKANIESARRIEYERAIAALLDERERKEREIAAQKAADDAAEQRRIRERIAAMQAFAAQLAAMEARSRAEVSNRLVAERQQRQDALTSNAAKLVTLEAQRRAEIQQTLIAERELAAAEAEVRRQLLLSADAAAARARGAATLARPASAPVQSNLAGALGGVIDPNGAALRTIGGVEAAVSKLEAAASKAKGPVKDYSAAIREAEVAQRSLVVIARQIDAFQNQMTALRAARAEFVQTRAAVADLVAQMRAGTAGEDITAKLAQAQSKLAAAAQNMAQQTTKARELRQALRDAGVATNDIAGVQANLTTAANRSTGALGTLTEAMKRYGEAKKSARREGEGLLQFFTRLSGERTTLSYFQRLRGEVLGLATAYVGIQSAVNLAKGAIDVALANQRIMNGLTAVFGGDVARARVEFTYLRNTAQRLSIDFDTAAKGYAKFAIAARASGASIETTRFIFENMALAARNAGLSNEEFEGTLKAVEQMMSKGVIQAEELKGQLGDRLPGAVSLLAQSMNKTVPELLKMMEQGGVTAEYVANLARTAGKTFGTTVDSAAARLQVAINQQNNATRAFKEALGDAGFIDAYTKFLNDLSTMLKGEDGQKLARELSALFSTIVDILAALARNIDTVKVGLTLLAAGGAVAWVVKLTAAWRTLLVTMGLSNVSLTAISAGISSMATSFGASVAAAGTLTGALGLLGTALKFLARSIPLIGTALLVFDIGSTLYAQWKSKSDKIKQEAADLKAFIDGKQTETQRVLGMSSKFGRLSDGTTPTGEAGVNFVSPDEAAAKAVDAALKKADKKLATQDKAARMGGAKAELEERIRIAQEELQALRDSTADQIKNEELKAKTLADIDKRLAMVRKIETQKFNNERLRQNQTDAQRQLDLAREVAQQLEQLQAKTADKESKIDPNATFADRLEARKRLAADAFNEISNKIQKLDELLAKNPKAKAEVDKQLADAGIQGGLAGARTALAGARNEAVNAAAKEAAQKEVDRIEKKLSDLQGELGAKLDTEQKIYEAGLQTQGELLDNRARLNAQYNQQIDESAAALQQFVTQYKSLLDPTAYNTIITRLQGLRATLSSNRTDLQDRLNAQEAATNRLLDERTRILEDIRQRESLGLISNEEATRRTNEVNLAYKQRILDNVKSTVDLIDALRKLDLPPEVMAQLDQMKAKMQGVALETANAKQQFSALDQQVQDSVAGGITSGLEGAVDGVLKVATGLDKSKDAWTAFRDAALGALSDVMRQIGLYILKTQVANSLAASSTEAIAAVGRKMGGNAAAGATETAAATTAATAISTATAAAAGELTAAGATIGTTLTTGATVAASELTAAGAILSASAAQLQAAATTLIIANSMQSSTGAFHTGGVIGSPAKMSRVVPPNIFASAARFHSGGIPGLKADEVPAVLQKGEEVLTRDNPRHIMNQGMGGGGKAASMGQRIVLVDDRSKVAEAMASAEGEQVTIMNIKRNLPTIRRMLQG